MSEMRKLDARQQLMVLLMEECGELIQECSKNLRKSELFDRQKFKDEVGDVYAMINLLHEWDVISWDEIEERERVKRKKLSKWSDLINESEVDWNGDVWKAFVEVRCKPFLDCYTCYADYGIGVILKRKNRNLLNIDNKNFEKLKFVEFYKDYKNLMNLILYDELKKII